MKRSFAFRLFVTILLLAAIQGSLQKPASVPPRATQLADGGGFIPDEPTACFPKPLYKAHPALQFAERKEVAEGGSCIPTGPGVCPLGG